MKPNITETLLASAEAHYPKKIGTTQRAFIRDYYHRLPGDDFSPQATKELITAALRHQHFGATRKLGQTLVEVYNLDASEHFAEPRTVINIVTEDRPFLVDTLTILLSNRNLLIHRTMHPVFQVKRSKAGRASEITRFQPDQDPQGAIESYIQFQVDYVSSSEHAALQEALLSTVDDVKTVVADWAPIREQVLTLAVELENNRSVDAEYSQLLRWLENHHFAMLGYCELTISGGNKKPVLRVDKPSALGFLRVLGQKSTREIRDFLPPLEYCREVPITITKTRQRSTIHRPAFIDCIIVSQPGGRGNGRRISCVLGLFSAAAFIRPTPEIPLLRHKSAWVLEQSTLRKGSYAYKALQMTLENLPRESLFQMDRESLFQTSMEILNHQERRKTTVYIHQDQCGHFYSCLVYVPRDLFHSDLRLAIQAHLLQALDGGELLFDVYFSESILTRMHFVVHTRSGKPVEVDHDAIERAIQEIARDWNESLRLALVEQHNVKQARSLMKVYQDAFPASYRDNFSVDDAVGDIDVIEALSDGAINSLLYISEAEDRQATHLKVYAGKQQLPLSDVLPIMENLGLRVIGERPYRVRRQQHDQVWIHDFEIVRQDGLSLNLIEDGDALRHTLERVWRGDAENDRFNQLVLDTGLDWRQIVVLRACFRYLRQIRLRYSQEYVIGALVGNRPIVIELMRLFETRFDPAVQPGNPAACEAQIAHLLEQVESLDEDRILCAMRDVIMAMLRTNYYQFAGDQLDSNVVTSKPEAKPYLSFKIDSAVVPRLPEPRPKYEIYVYSPRVEGIHLRGGKVARGGLRWSDRLEDYRTEVLGLVKAQMVKNAVIVPVGSKGGFVPRQLPMGDRDAVQKEVIFCYQTFIRGLLDLTDNLSAKQVLHPPRVVRYDDDDPYLVVAADKGTASFSDIANEISVSRQFWLGDAFASGGSMGYDHKKMGITARGAWESVKRHFREIGKDIQEQEFTVAGIGDMSGDVFGNGMLLSEHTSLVAAFNHLHIFIDPMPDASSSFTERQRLFALPRSSWSDYEASLISKGGGVFDRKAKSITLTPQIKKLLDTDRSKCAPTELINLILKMPVDLLWNGGIGTYIKASDETHEDAQDKANDVLRVDASELRCKVLGEGGNLGVTQKARIEFSMLGGYCNTDAIDNSAGVDTSDHEVNIKILFNRAIEDGKTSMKQRNKLLTQMEQDIAALVLRNNYVQTQTISIAVQHANRMMPQLVDAIRILEQGGLNRDIEFLPDDAELAARIDKGTTLTRPELSVLLSYSKMDFYDALLVSDLPDDKALDAEIEAYFPALLSRRFKAQIHSHRLKREIIATHLGNRFIGQMGMTFHLTLSMLMNVGVAEMTRAWLVAESLMQSDRLVQEIEALDNTVASRPQMEALFQVSSMMAKVIVWLIRQHRAGIDIVATIARYQKQVSALTRDLDVYLSLSELKTVRTRQKRLVAHAVPEPLAAEFSRLSTRAATLEIAGISISSKQHLDLTARVYFQLESQLGLNWIARAISHLAAENQWHERARFSLASDLVSNHAAITRKVLNGIKHSTGENVLVEWQAAYQAEVDAVLRTTAQLKAQDKPDFAMLSVLMSGLSQLA